MEYLAKKQMSRRTILRGAGVCLSLPLLEAMLPAGTPLRRTAAATTPTRFACFEMVHGAAGSNTYGIEKNLWSPAAEGAEFDLTPSSLAPLEPYRDYLTIISNTDSRPAEAWEPREVGGDHFRSAAVFMTQAHPKQTQGSDVYCGTSIDQMYAHRVGQETPIPSLQLCIESVDQAGGCGYGYSCVYTDSISWASPTEPLPMVRNPRAVFEAMFGDGRTSEQRAARLKQDRSILDWITRDITLLKRNLSPADRLRLDDYTEKIREVERRIQRVEEYNASGVTRELPDAPIGVPDSYTEHVQIMLDLQALAFEAGITHVTAFKLSRDGSGRVFPESGVRSGFHGASHYGNTPSRIEDFAAINKYHVGLLPYFLDRLKGIEEADGTLLDKTMILYGSSMGDSNVHNHKRCPLILLGHANGAVHGRRHVKAADGTPMANAFLSIAHRLGMDDLEVFGDSTGEIAF